MTNILAIDTCTEVCSVSLLTQSKKTSRFLHGVDKSSGLVLSLCDEVFAETGLSASALDLIVYTKGPGAFTGVRMCVSVVQGLSLAFDIPTLGFSTLALVGFGARQKYQTNHIAVALDARMGEVYWGVFEGDILTNENLSQPDKLPKFSADYLGVGSGWGVHQKALCEATNIENYHADFYPKAENLIALALAHIEQQKPLNDDLPLPTYLRNNVAKKSLK